MLSEKEIEIIIKEAVQIAVKDSVTEVLGQYKIPKEEHYLQHKWISENEEWIDNSKPWIIEWMEWEKNFKSSFWKAVAKYVAYAVISGLLLLFALSRVSK